MRDHNMNNDELFAMIDEGLAATMSGSRDCVELFDVSDKSTAENQFLFFIKPEVTLRRGSPRFEEIITLILDKIAEFGLTMERIRILSGSYLGAHDIMAEHYGVINRLARSARDNLSEKAKQTFVDLYGSPVEEVRVLGGFEYLSENPKMSAPDLSALWLKHKNEKLAGGTYCVRLEGHGEPIFLINGFHPNQLLFFTGPNRAIVVFTLGGAHAWSVARQKFIGATDPSVAEAGSIRRELFRQKDYLGLPDISQGLNGVHLSAGPVEGLAELCRFNSDFSENGASGSFKDFTLGKKLQAFLSESQIAALLRNIDVVYNGSRISIFDLTEERDTHDVLQLLKELAGQLP